MCCRDAGGRHEAVLGLGVVDGRLPGASLTISGERCVDVTCVCIPCVCSSINLAPSQALAIDLSGGDEPYAEFSRAQQGRQMSRRQVKYMCVQIEELSDLVGNRM